MDSQGWQEIGFEDKVQATTSCENKSKEDQKSNTNANMYIKIQMGVQEFFSENYRMFIMDPQGHT